MEASQSLARTDYQKYTTYRGDGYGRDSYILLANGGLRAPQSYSSNAPKIGF